MNCPTTVNVKRTVTIDEFVAFPTWEAKQLQDINIHQIVFSSSF